MAHVLSNILIMSLEAQLECCVPLKPLLGRELFEDLVLRSLAQIARHCQVNWRNPRLPGALELLLPSHNHFQRLKRNNNNNNNKSGQ